MALSGSAKAGIAVLIVAGVGLGSYGIYSYEKSKVPPPSTTSNYVLTLTGPTSDTSDTPTTYTVNLTDNGVAVSGIVVTLSITGPTNDSLSLATDSSGNAVFDVEFPDSGSYSLVAYAEVS